MQRGHNGVTIVGVLVAVAVIAIVAFVAVLQLRGAQLRSRVARTKADMRTLAMAIESYLVDNMIYPPWGIGHPGPGNVRTYNDMIAEKTGNRSGVAGLPSFLLNDMSQPGGQFDTLTSATVFWRYRRDGSAPGGWEVERKPHSYIARYPIDSFCADGGATFVYWSVWPGGRGPDGKPAPRGLGWIFVSPGPDGDYDLPGSYDAYDPAIAQPSWSLLTGANAKGSAFTYDPTNGLFSDGDVYRVKQ